MTNDQRIWLTEREQWILRAALLSLLHKDAVVQGKPVSIEEYSALLAKLPESNPL